MSDFKPFEKIQPIGKIYMSITQKIHGTNAQVYIYQKDDGQMDLKAGCRTRWIVPGNDNFGFAQYVYDNKQEFIEKLGLGVHFGEWAGPGINSGEGLKQRVFLLFNVRRWEGKALPIRCLTVPQLYSGNMTKEAIDQTFESLRQNGSQLVAGYMSPEGIVIEIDGKFYKRVFKPEETGWTSKKNKIANTSPKVDICHLLQPRRLQKLLSKDEAYIRDYPKSLTIICKEYVSDLEAEQQLTGTEEEMARLKKELGRHIFQFVKGQINDDAATQ